MAKGGSAPLNDLAGSRPAGAVGYDAGYAATGQTSGAKHSRAGTKLRLNPPREDPTMTKCLIYMASAALVGLTAREALATPAAWSGGMARSIVAATADAKDAPLVL